MESTSEQTTKSKTRISPQYILHSFLGIIVLLEFLVVATSGSLHSRLKLRTSPHTPFPWMAMHLSNESPSPSPERISESPSPPAIVSPAEVFQTSVNALSLTWTTCGACPETPEASVSGDTVSVGVANRSSSQFQNMAIHGAATALPASANYTITFDYDWFTFDSYSSPTEGYVGFWDSFSVSVASLPYWQLTLSDPVTKSKIPSLGLIWGGPTFGTVLHHTSGTKTITVPGNVSGNNYLNVVLDTRTSPFADHNFPSWGTVTIKSIMTDSGCASIASQAANLATTVVPGTYSYGGKGYTCAPTRFVDSQEILAGYSQYHALTCTNFGPPFACETAPGLDCSGLVFWSYNKTVGATTKSHGFLQAENSTGQCNAAASDPISENELRAGDIACFPGHVAMYVGTGHFRDSIEAANCTAGIAWTTKTNLKGRTGFQGFRRLKCSTQYALTIKSHSPISLVVTDPDGYTISVDTTKFTNEEVLHEIPGVLYYVQDDVDGDVVFGPILKSGVYRIGVVPKTDAPPNATFSLEVTGAGYLLNLAQNVPISGIPPEGYSIRSTGEEITPVNPNLTPTTAVLSSDVNPAQIGELVTFTVTVSSSGGTPLGTVVIKDSGTVLSTIPLNSSGIATFSTDSLAQGVHSILAEYLGDGVTFSGSVSNTILQQVKPTPAVQISNLISNVIGSNLSPEGIKTSLSAKLNAALVALQSGDVPTSCSRLQDFINEVNAQRGKKLSNAVSDSFRSSAEQIMSDLGCGPPASTTNKMALKSTMSNGTILPYALYMLISSLSFHI